MSAAWLSQVLLDLRRHFRSGVRRVADVLVIVSRGRVRRPTGSSAAQTSVPLKGGTRRCKGKIRCGFRFLGIVRHVETCCTTLSTSLSILFVFSFGFQRNRNKGVRFRGLILPLFIAQGSRKRWCRNSIAEFSIFPRREQFFSLIYAVITRR